MQFFLSSLSLVIIAFFAVGLIVCLVVFLRTHELPPRVIRWGFFVSVALLVVRGGVYTALQYVAWSGDALARHLLPPTATAYFVRYSLFHFFFSFLLSLAIACFLLLVFWGLQHRSQGRWLDTNERFLVFFGALAAGWPGAILYAIGVFFLPLVVTPWLLQKSLSNPSHPPFLKREENLSPPLQKEGEGGFRDGRRRVRLAPFIVLSALLAMAITPFILPRAPWLSVLTCSTCI